VPRDIEFHSVANYSAQAGFLETFLLVVACVNVFVSFGQKFLGSFVADSFVSAVWIRIARELFYDTVSFRAQIR
jgi:hypothetical protein